MTTTQPTRIGKSTVATRVLSRRTMMSRTG
jgi:hypothetical protein